MLTVLYHKHSRKFLGNDDICCNINFSMVILEENDDIIVPYYSIGLKFATKVIKKKQKQK